MLKLEKIKKTREIIIHFREKDNFFLSRSFLQALSLSLCLHLCGIGLFHIQPFSLGKNKFLDPISVNIHLDNFTTVQNDTKNTLPKNIVGPPRSSYPQIDEIKIPIESTKPLEFIKKKEENTSLFNFIKNWTKSFVKPSPLALSYYPFTINLIGNLYKKKYHLLSPPELLEKKGPLNQYIIKYLVRVHNKTGRLYWFDQQLSSKIKKIDQQAEKILKNIIFDPQEEGFETLGEIEIVIRNN